MGITTSYNKRTGLRYAYDTTYEMDEAAGTGSVPTAAVAARPSADRLAGVEAACAALARSCDDLADVARSLEREVRLLRES